MDSRNRTRSVVELHVAVLLFGFTAILGALIQISAVSIVAWRVACAAVVFWAISPWTRIIQLPLSIIWRLAAIGIIVALHWIGFYGAIKLSNASIALVCLSTTSFFSAFIEPAIMRRDINWRDVLMGLLIIPAMILVVNGVEASMYIGISVGIASALFAATFSAWNKRIIDRVHPVDMSTIEMTSASLFVLPLVIIFQPRDAGAPWLPVGVDWAYMAVLVLLCTNLAYILSVRALRHLSAFESVLLINLEPVYGIVLAYFILGEHEQMSPSFYLGALLILTVIYINGWLRRRDLKRSE